MAVAVLAGLGLLDLGSRLRAGHLPYAELSSAMGAGMEYGALSPTDDSLPNPSEEQPLSPSEAIPLAGFPWSDPCSSKGETDLTDPTGNPDSLDYGGLPGVGRAEGPERITRLRLQETEDVPAPPCSSIFHPPRAVSRA